MSEGHTTCFLLFFPFLSRTHHILISLLDVHYIIYILHLLTFESPSYPQGSNMLNKIFTNFDHCQHYHKAIYIYTNVRDVLCSLYTKIYIYVYIHVTNLHFHYFQHWYKHHHLYLYYQNYHN